jgi:hypothetical protein
MGFEQRFTISAPWTTGFSARSALATKIVAIRETPTLTDILRGAADIGMPPFLAAYGAVLSEKM